MPKNVKFLPPTFLTHDTAFPWGDPSVSSLCFCSDCTRSLAVAKIADRTDSQWPWRSSNDDDFHLIRKGVCHLLLFNINFGPISHRQLLAWKNSKPLQMETWLLLTVYRKSPAPCPMVLLPTPYDLPFSHNTAQLAYHNALWPYKIIQGHRFLCRLKANMRHLI